MRLLGLIADIPPPRQRLVAQAEWEGALRAHFPLLRVGMRLVLRPAWEVYTPRQGEVVLTLDPGAAFGTGHHPTTRLCIDMLERWIGPRVADIGTGSGILAIAAAALGAQRVIGMDIDPLAVTAARRNVRLNRLQRRVRVLRGSIPPTDAGPFDLVLANITMRVVGQLLPNLHGCLAPDGALIVSGVLVEQRAELDNRLAATGFRVVEEREEGDWLALLLKAAESGPAGNAAQGR